MTNPIDTIKRVRELFATGLMPKAMKYERLGQLVVATDIYHRFCDMRGWGHFTGTRDMAQEEAAAAQDARGELVAMLPTMATLIEEQAALIKQMSEALESARFGGCFKHPQISDNIASALELSAPYAELEDL